MSVYERQKQPLNDRQENYGVRGSTTPEKECHKCGRVSSRLRECEHCCMALCQDCFYDKVHYREYNLNYGNYEEDV